MTATRTLRAHAKLTRTLRIAGVRADGYHLIDAEMVSLDLHDVVEIDAVDGNGPGATEGALTLTGPYAAGVSAGDDNLVTRALRHVRRRAHVVLDKRIPHGGGLGGGSADAAAILAWAEHPTDAGGLRSAATLGADIPFCLIGGRARVGGIGEVVEPLPHVDLSFTLVVPPLVVATPAVYGAWDALGGPSGHPTNDLEPAALQVEPRLRWWRDAIAERTGGEPTLAGSGATWFAHGEREDALADLVDEGAQVVAARSVPRTVARPADTL